MEFKEEEEEREENLFLIFLNFLGDCRLVESLAETSPSRSCKIPRWSSPARMSKGSAFGVFWGAMSADVLEPELCLFDHALDFDMVAWLSRWVGHTESSDIGRFCHVWNHQNSELCWKVNDLYFLPLVGDCLDSSEDVFLQEFSGLAFQVPELRWSNLGGESELGRLGVPDSSVKIGKDGALPGNQVTSPQNHLKSPQNHSKWPQNHLRSPRNQKKPPQNTIHFGGWALLFGFDKWGWVPTLELCCVSSPGRGILSWGGSGGIQILQVPVLGWVSWFCWRWVFKPWAFLYWAFRVLFKLLPWQAS